MKNALDRFGEIGARIAEHGLVVMCDFDGTLAPIVENPRDAYMDAASARALTRLAKYVPTAIITGRSLSDVRGRVKIPGIAFAGNHGSEWYIDDQEGSVAPTISREVRARTHLIARQFEGTFIEDKGHTLSLHYRHAPASSHPALRKAVQSMARESGGIRVIEGVLVWNLLPEGIHKGTAAKMVYKRLAPHKESVPLFIGDDATDEDAFKALKRGLTVRVGKNPKSAAEYYFPSQKDVSVFLGMLADAI